MKCKHAILICLVLVGMVIPVLLGPLSAQASVPTHEWSLSGLFPGQTPPAGISAKEVSFWSNPLGIFSVSWDSLARFFMKKILHEFTQATVLWIRTGQSPAFSAGTEGSLFITNIDEFLLDAADNQASLMLSDYFGPSWNKLCTPFRLSVGLSLSQSYGRGYGSFGPKARCNITDIVKNLEDFYTSFENGGWAAWMQTARYENTAWGLLTLAEEESRERETRAVRANLTDTLAGLGFPGDRTCVEALHVATNVVIENPPPSEVDGKTIRCIRTITKTPGKAIEDQVANIYGNEWRSLEIADEIDEVLFAVFEKLLSWILSGGDENGLLGAPINTPPPGHFGCNVPTGRPSGCACTVNTQCASNQCIAGKCGDGTPQCNNGIDDDGDGKIDLADPGCTSSTDTSEGDTIPPPPPPPPPPPVGQ